MFSLGHGYCFIVISHVDLGQEEGEIFDPSKLDPERCESCYGAETEDLK